MIGELVRVKATDGLELVGFYAAPQGSPASRAVLHVHGLAGNFYENRFVSAIGDAVVAKGVAFLTLNLRGHEYWSDNLVGDGEGTTSLLGGATWDVFGECIHDLGGGAAFLAERGHERLYFEGHSLGTVKTVYYLTEVGDPRAAGAVLLSPPDMLGLQEERTEGRSADVLARARVLVATGRGDTLMDDSGYVVPLSAATVLATYGDPSKTDVFPFRLGRDAAFERFAAVDVPILATLGTVDEAITVLVEDAIDLLSAKAAAAPRVSTVSIPGANHVYWGHEAELARVVSDFVAA